jgi:hypothetical protein
LRKGFCQCRVAFASRGRKRCDRPTWSGPSSEADFLSVWKLNGSRESRLPLLSSEPVLLEQSATLV